MDPSGHRTTLAGGGCGDQGKGGHQKEVLGDHVRPFIN